MADKDQDKDKDQYKSWGKQFRDITKKSAPLIRVYADKMKKKKKKKKEMTESEKMPHGMLRVSQQVIVKQPKKKLYEKVMLNPRKKYKKEKPKD